MPDLTLLKIIAWGILFLAMCLVTGRSVPDAWLFPHRSRPLQLTLIGFSLLVIVLRFSFREHTPIIFAFSILTILGLTGLIRFILEVRTTRHSVSIVTRLRREAWVYLLLMLPATAILFFPYLSSGAVFFQNRGPDLDGHLLSAAFIFDGNSYPRLLRSFEQASGSFAWWDHTNAHWHLPDFRESIAVEVFIRSGRYTHAVLSSVISWVSGQPIWLGYFIVTGCSALLCPIIIFEACQARGIDKRDGLLLAVLLTSSHTYILLDFEGIAGHLVAMPLLLFVTLNYRLLYGGMSTTGQKLVLAILLNALLSTFGEGIQILAVFTALFVLLAFVSRKKLGLWSPQVVTSLMIVLGLSIAISPSIIADFVLWSYYRYMQNFSGGALHDSWSILSIVGSVPYVTVPFSGATKPLIMASYGTRLLEAGVLMALGAFLSYRKHLAGFDLTLAAATIFIFTLPNHAYASWKAAAIFQALITIGLFQTLPGRFFVIRRRWLLYGLVALSLVGLVQLLSQYNRHAVHLRPEQFLISREGLQSEAYAIVTPSPYHVYFKLGTTGEAYLPSLDWSRDWHQDFSIGKAPQLYIALYYDCAAEGDSRCTTIAHTLGERVKPRTLVPTDIPLTRVLEESGLVNQTALDDFVRDTFGVERWCERGPAPHAHNLSCR